MESYFKLEFPESFCLDYDKYYTDEKYNKLRRCKLILFAQCIGTDKILENEKNKTMLNNIRKKSTNKLLNDIGIDADTIKIINKYMYPKPYDKEYIVNQLEKGCLNRTIIKSRAHNIRSVWSNPKFVDLYQ